MKDKIHPKYADATITCACGEVIHTRSTKKEIKIGVCSKCHPFFTGTQKFVDTAGRVEKFRKKYAESQKKKKRAKRSEPETPAAEAVGETKQAAVEQTAAKQQVEVQPEAPAAEPKNQVEAQAEKKVEDKAVEESAPESSPEAKPEEEKEGSK